jgi:glycosyltransferase involved in cell wall biosynthesis
MGPRVSVVITTYNQGPYIGETIRSALSQTFTNREIIVVDDGSKDETGVVVTSFGDQITSLLSKLAGIEPGDRAMSWGIGRDGAWAKIRVPGPAVQVSQGPTPPARRSGAWAGLRTADRATPTHREA